MELYEFIESKATKLEIFKNKYRKWESVSEEDLRNDMKNNDYSIKEIAYACFTYKMLGFGIERLEEISSIFYTIIKEIKQRKIFLSYLDKILSDLARQEITLENAVKLAKMSYHLKIEGFKETRNMVKSKITSMLLKQVLAMKAKDTAQILTLTNFFKEITQSEINIVYEFNYFFSLICKPLKNACLEAAGSTEEGRKELIVIVEELLELTIDRNTEKKLFRMKEVLIKKPSPQQKKAGIEVLSRKGNIVPRFNSVVLKKINASDLLECVEVPEQFIDCGTVSVKFFRALYRSIKGEKDVLLKVYQTKDCQFIDRINQEVKTLQILSDNISDNTCFLEYHGVIIDDNQIVIVLEYTSTNFMSFLKNLQNRNEFLQENQLKFYYRSILNSFAIMEKLDIYHLDIKLENFLMDSNKTLKIVNFFTTLVPSFESKNQNIRQDLDPDNPCDPRYKEFDINSLGIIFLQLAWGQASIDLTNLEYLVSRISYPWAKRLISTMLFSEDKSIIEYLYLLKILETS